MQMRNSSMWFALAAAVESEWALAGAGVKPCMGLEIYSLSISLTEEVDFP